MYSLFNEFKEIESHKYLLRKITYSDSRDILEMYSDDDVMKFNSGQKISYIEDIIKLIDVIDKGFEKKWFIRWGVIEKSTNEYLGDLALHHFDENENKVQIGYMLKKAHWNKGIMSEAAPLLINHVSENTPVQTIEAHIYPQNTASIKLAEKLGFKFKELSSDVKDKNKVRVIYSIKLR